MPLLEYLLQLPPWQPPGGPAEGTDGRRAFAVGGNGATVEPVNYSLIAGDLEPDMEVDCVRLFDPSTGAPLNPPQPADLTGALALQLRWRKPDGTVSMVTLTAISLATGRLKRIWVTGDTDQIGIHLGQVVVTTSNGEVETFPNDGSHVIWSIYPQLTAGSPAP